jgi:hypothetical protein
LRHGYPPLFFLSFSWVMLLRHAIFSLFGQP